MLYEFVSNHSFGDWRAEEESPQVPGWPTDHEFQASPAYTVRVPHTNDTCIMDVCVITANICVTVFTINSQVTNLLIIIDSKPKIQIKP